MLGGSGKVLKPSSTEKGANGIQSVQKGGQAKLLVRDTEFVGREAPSRAREFRESFISIVDLVANRLAVVLERKGAVKVDAEILRGVVVGNRSDEL